MIKMLNYSFNYEDYNIFKDFNFTLKEGEKKVLLGSNGSGKSTLLRVLAGLYFGDGEYLFNDIKIDKRSIKKLRRDIAILFQNPDSMIFNPTVYDEIAFSLKNFNFNNIKDRVYKIAKEFKIEDLLNKSPIYLSGGEKQKVMLASILVYEPKLLLLDEPTSATDPKTTGWLIDFLLDLNITTLIATHDLGFAYEVANSAYVLDNRHKLIYEGNIEELMKNLDTLQRANLIHKHKHKHKNFIHSHYHLHFN